MLFECVIVYVVCICFFFKQKTAYDVRISDWSSDVCSSDLPYKQLIMHLDFQRVNQNEAIRMSVPLHFVNGDISPAGKAGDVVIMHELTEVAISCLPADLPLNIEVDLSELKLGDTVHLSSL